MHPRPIYRWKTFWIGLLAASFVAWAWWDSVNGFAWCQTRSYAASNEAAAISLEHDPRSPIAGFDKGRHPTDICGPLEIRAFPAPAFVHGHGIPFVYEAPANRSELLKTYHGLLLEVMKVRPPQAWKLVIPHWLILLTITTPWLALLVWRSRRMKHAP